MKIAEGSKFLYERRQLSSVQSGGVFPAAPSWRGSDLVGLADGAGGAVPGGMPGGPHPGMAGLAGAGPGHPIPRSMTGKAHVAPSVYPASIGSLNPGEISSKTPETSEEAETVKSMVMTGSSRGGGGGGGGHDGGNKHVEEHEDRKETSEGGQLLPSGTTVTVQPIQTTPGPSAARPLKWRANLGQHPKLMKCPHCYKQIYTKITYKSDDCTYFAAGICCICCCCFIPFCLRELKAAHHFCPKCQVYIGSY